MFATYIEIYLFATLFSFEGLIGEHLNRLVGDHFMFVCYRYRDIVLFAALFSEKKTSVQNIID